MFLDSLHAGSLFPATPEAINNFIVIHLEVRKFILCYCCMQENKGNGLSLEEMYNSVKKQNFALANFIARYFFFSILITLLSTLILLE